MRRGIGLGALVLALAGAVWLAGRGGRGTEHRAGRAPASGEPAHEIAADAGDELRTAEALAPEPDAGSADPDGETPGDTGRAAVRGDASRGSRSRAPIRGQLRILGTEDVLDEVLTIRLRSGDVRVKETVTSASDGSFTSTVAFPRGFVLAEVLYPAGDTVVDHEARFDPRAEEVWPVPVPWPTFVRGRCIDTRGEPLEDVEVFVAAAGSTAFDASSAADGTFRMEATLGARTVRFHLGFERAALRVEVARGPNELGDVVLPFSTARAEIGGVLTTTGRDPEAVVELVALDTGRTLEVEADVGPERDGTSTFLFPAVPPGEYRVRVVAYDGRRYEPAERTVAPPAFDLEFRAVGDAAELVARFVDERGAVVDGSVLVFLHGRWRDYEGSSPGDVERWIVIARDGRFAEGKLEEGNVLTARFSPGPGEVFLFREAGEGGAPLAGAEVIGAERVLGTSDATGLALVRLPEIAGDFEYRLAGWSVQSVWEAHPTVVHLVQE